MTELLWVLGGLALLAASLRLWAWLARPPVVARLFGEMPWLPAQWCEPIAEGAPVQFTTGDGVRLDGTYFCSSAPRKGVVLFCHELNGNRWNATPYVAELRRQGFDVFAFDFRNHGSSGRTAGYEPMPWVSRLETLDVEAAVDYLCRRPDAEPGGVGVLGVGRGGTAALCVAAAERRIAAVLVDSVVPLERMQQHCARRFLRRRLHLGWAARRAPGWLLRPLAAWAKLVLGWRCRCRPVNVERAAAKLSQPVLFIHGRQDAYVPVEAVRGLQAAIGENAWLWLVPHARHAQAIVAATELYGRRAAYFFAHALHPAAHADGPHATPPVRVAAGQRRTRRLNGRAWSPRRAAR